MELNKREKIDQENITSKEREKSDFNEDNLYTFKSDLDDQNKLTIAYWICMFIVGILLFNLAMRLHLSCEFENDLFNCPSVVEKQSEFSEFYFNDSLARKHLQSISKLGNRPAGSTANEIHTPIFLLNYLQKLKLLHTGQKLSNIEITINEQVAQLNSFPLFVFGNHVTSIYDQIKNIVVRLHDINNDNKSKKSTGAILINCHYDSFFGGPGASDDLVSCVMMLETIHTILKNQPVNLKFDVIFLFNGAEENMLQGSHAFVSLHPWARDVKLVVNLEAAGSGGRQMVFQASHNNPWLMSELATVFRQPLATVIGQEIFSANLIPSDTDFRIFRDFGRIPGIDIAFIANGYVYHTKYDTEDRIPQTCLRSTGNNIMKLVLKLANSNSVPISLEDEKYIQKSILRSQRIIYFDFLGFFLISYPECFGIIVHVCLFFLAVGLVFWRMQSLGGISFQSVFKAILSQLAWAALTLVLGLVLGYLVHLFGTKMSWYAIRYNAVGLYLIPLVWFYFIYHQFLSPFFCDFSSSYLTFECYRNSSLLLLGFLTVAMTVFRLLSSYVIAMWLMFLIINFLVSMFIERLDRSPVNVNVLNFFRDTLCFTIPFLYSAYLVYILYDVFIPILGRAGPTYPDVIISGLTALSVIVPGIVLFSTVSLTSKNSRKWLTFLFFHFSLSFYIFIHCTQFGFPYNQSEAAPRKQRIFINHVTRNIRNELGQTRISESGIWFLSLDSNKLVPLKTQLLDVIREPIQEVFCELRPYCGYPMLFPFAKIIDNSLWIPQKPHQIKPSASIIILSKVTHISGMVNVTMKICGPSHTHIYVMIPSSMRITSWSHGPDPPLPIKMPFSNLNYKHYFIYYSYGKKPVHPLKIWMMFLPKGDLSGNAPKDSSNKQVEIALGAHYLTAKTSELETMAHIMPNWIVATPLASTYEHIVVDFDQNLSYVQ